MNETLVVIKETIKQTLDELERESPGSSCELANNVARFEQFYAELEKKYAMAMSEVERERMAKVKFIMEFSHEMKSPIAAIISFLRVIRDGYVETEADRNKYLDKSIERAENLLETIKDMLVLSQSKMYPETVALEVQDVVELAKATFDDYRDLARQKGISDYEFIISGSVVLTKISAPMMRRVFENLYSNAIKYNRDGGAIHVSVDILDVDGKEFVHIAVTDSGIGISPDDLTKLFGMFYRGSAGKQTKREGTGLGLSLVQTIIDAHGGKVWAESELGVGSTFHISVPAAG